MSQRPNVCLTVSVLGNCNFNVADLIMVFGNIIIWIHVSTVLPTAVFCHQGWHCFIPRAIWFLIKCVLINQVYFIYIFFFNILEDSQIFSIYTLYNFRSIYIYIFRKVLISIIFTLLIKVCIMKTDYQLYLILHGHFFFYMIRHIPYLIRPWA